MKQFIAILFCIAVCGPVNITWAQDGKNSSTLVFDETVWDFGEIEEAKGLVSYTFKFKNNGGNAIVIENVSVSCGCTSPEYSKQPVKPSGRGEIKITYDPEGRPGYFSKDIYVISNGSKNRNTLTVQGSVIPRPRTVEEDYPFAMSDGMRFANLIGNFRYAEQEVPTSIAIGYASTSGQNTALAFIVEPNDGHIKVSAPETVCPGCKGDITITSNIPRGDFYGKFAYRIFPVVNGKREKQAFSVTGIATENFSGTDKSKAPESKLSEYFHNFGKVKRHKQLDHEFIFYNTGKAPLVIRHIETRGGISTGLKKGTVIQPGKELKFKCTLDTSGADKGTLTRVVSIITNDPVRPMREIRLAATVE